MFFKLSKSLLMAGLVVVPMNVLAQDANTSTSGGMVPLPPPGPYVPVSNPKTPPSLGRAIISGEKPEKPVAKPAKPTDFAPLNFDPGQTQSKSAQQAGTAETDVPAVKETSKPTYAPADTATIPIEQKPASTLAPVVGDKIATPPPLEKLDEKSSGVGQTKRDADVPGVNNTEKSATPAKTEGEKSPKPTYAPPDTAKLPEIAVPVEIPEIQGKPAQAAKSDGEANKSKETTPPEYPPADTAKIPVDEKPKDKADTPLDPPVLPKLEAVPPVAEAVKKPVAPSGQSTVVVPRTAVPGYRYPVQPRAYGFPPQYNQRPPQYYPRGYVPRQGYWQPYQQMPPRWQYPPAQRPIVRPAPYYQYPAPNYWYPYPPQQRGWPRQPAPQGNNRTGN